MRDLQTEGHSISICSITIFELAAKGAKFVSSGKIEEARVRRGLAAILGDANILQVDFRHEEILTRATALRANLNDFVDCLILAAGAGTCDALISEDEELQEIVSRNEVRVKLRPINPAFKVSKAKEP